VCSSDLNMFLRFIANFSAYFIYAFAILFVLGNLGINITSLIAGLGIGGIAIALALQNVLTDIFSAITIYFDKPFQVGDYIVLDQGDMGIVQQIGLKSTRITTLHGHELVISNKELTQIRVNNYKKMTRRRVVFPLSVIYDTSNEKLEKIPNLIKNIFDQIEPATFDRCHFKSFGPYSLDFEIVYYMDVPDYYSYMDTLQKINLDIKKDFESEGIVFAYPSQTLYIEK
ncbi:MAG: mechanosensitive ion channel family protein, partial [Candidatus ainarchaeum sp.]|nr:mechanosensitive ion channel family protein [Candidatus ainarchaeum sp.]